MSFKDLTKKAAELFKTKPGEAANTKPETETPPSDRKTSEVKPKKT